MAAGLGSRYGQGIKQLEHVGPNGEIIIDYSIHDAIEAGFNKVVFIIRKDLEKDFKEIIGDRVSKKVKVAYAYQEIDKLPEGFTVPEGRIKPWGTGHAILMTRGIVNEPFCVINADDYYGKEGFRVVHDYMVNHMDANAGSFDMCMAGFILKNTLSANGSVTRGVCQADADGMLTDIRETFRIEKLADGTMSALDEQKNPVHVDENQIVSMNMWGLPPKFLDILEDGFCEFLKERGTEMKSEYLLPTIIDGCIKSGKGSVKVLKSNDKWFGVTYHEDKEYVVDSIRALVEKGVYPASLYN